MNVIKLSELLQFKYKVAQEQSHLEKSLRERLNPKHSGSLFAWLNKFSILRACAISDASKPKNAYEQMAVKGYLFCKELVSMVDYLASDYDSISVGEIREVLLNLAKLINDNKGNSKVQFENVSELISKLFPIKNSHSDSKRNGDLQSKSRTGLAKLYSVIVGMLKDIQKLEFEHPEKFVHKIETDVDINSPLPDRFKPQRGSLSVYDIVDFIRQHGDDYGISSKEDWGMALTDDHELKEQMTTVINALNRGEFPRDSADAKMRIAEIIKHHEDRKSNNAQSFED